MILLWFNGVIIPSNVINAGEEVDEVLLWEIAKWEPFVGFL